MLATFAPLTFLGNHDVTRLASQLRDERHLAHALVILLTVGGIPSIYAGDEHAFRGVKEHRAGGDDAIRPAFPDRPDQLATPQWPHYRLHQFLIGFRRRHPWLVRARTTVTTLTSTAIVYTVSDGSASLAVALNIADQPAELTLPTGGWQRAAGTAKVSSHHVSLPASAWAILTNAET